MGYIAHNAIIVTTWNADAMLGVVAKCASLGAEVIGPSKSEINQTQTILICPDGSKEGWEESDAGDRRRSELRDYFDTWKYEDGSSPLEWCEVRYGGDDKAAVVVEHAWAATVPGKAAP